MQPVGQPVRPTYSVQPVSSAPSSVVEDRLAPPVPPPTYLLTLSPHFFSHHSSVFSDLPPVREGMKPVQYVQAQMPRYASDANTAVAYPQST